MYSTMKVIIIKDIHPILFENEVALTSFSSNWVIRLLDVYIVLVDLCGFTVWCRKQICGLELSKLPNWWLPIVDRKNWTDIPPGVSDSRLDTMFTSLTKNNGYVMDRVSVNMSVVCIPGSLSLHIIWKIMLHRNNWCRSLFSAMNVISYQWITSQTLSLFNLRSSFDIKIS